MLGDRQASGSNLHGVQPPLKNNLVGGSTTVPQQTAQSQQQQ